VLTSGYHYVKIHNEWATNYKEDKMREYTTKEGYRYIKVPWHPHCSDTGYVAFHRLVVEAKLERVLERDELIHHIDGNPYNNDPYNLEIVTKGQHSFEHKKSHICNKEFLYSEYITKDKTMEQIAKEQACTRQTVIKWLHYFNIVKPNKGEDILSEIVRLKALGISQLAIAKCLGMSQITVSRLLQKSRRI
jgi:hypothetical protein